MQTPVVPPFVPFDAPPHGARRRSPGWVPWAVALVALALVAGVGAVLLLGGEEKDRAAADTRDGQTRSTPTGRPDTTGTDGPVEQPDPADVDDLTDGVRARVPATAPPSRDRQGDPVRFAAANMWDDQARTAWRMPGDGTGETLTFDLGTEVVLTEVGLINGYAKVDGADNWYRGNRRIRAVQWEFDDGTRITQELRDERALQMAQIGPVSTTTVKLHLLAVTAPGTGPTGRDFTAISEVKLLGAPG